MIQLLVFGTNEEIERFYIWQEHLQRRTRVFIAVETLQLWSERMLATGAIDPEQYKAYKAGLNTEEG